MGTNTIDTAISNGDVIDASDHNELASALTNQFVGRNTSGVAEAGRSLGTTALPWGTIFGGSLILGGQAIDTANLVAEANRVISGPSRTLSALSDFLRADGSTNAFSLLGNTVNLLLSINATAVTVDTDIVVGSLALAPSSNNTCAVNDSNMTDDLYAGEDSTVITIDAVGSNISDKVGQYITLKSSNNEYMYAYVKDATTLTNVFRGFFLDDSGDPVERANLSNNDVLTLMATGNVFVENNGTTVDVSYTQPVYSFTAPSSPNAGDYWYDISNALWKRHDGTSFVIINRILVGKVVIDAANCVATRSIDYSNGFRELNNVELESFSTSVVESKSHIGAVSVYGNTVNLGGTKLTWNITTDLASGLSESTSTVYYLYLTELGKRVMDTQKPYYREDLRGDYHPYESWRLLGMAYNDSSDDLTTIWSEKGENVYKMDYVSSFSTTSTDATDITGASVLVLSRGRQKMNLYTVGDGGSEASHLECVNSATSSRGDLFILIGSSIIYTLRMGISSGGASSTLYRVPSSVVSYSSDLPLGAKTIKLQIRSGTSGATAKYIASQTVIEVV